MIHFKRQDVPKSLQNFPPGKEQWKSELLKGLDANFGKKCAYCEQLLTSIQIDHFVPECIDSKQTFSWRNLFPACPECKTSKGSKFPMHQGEPLLLNPCEDDPQKLFLYNGEGHIIPLNGDLRAIATIETLCLNRVNLVRQRRVIYERIAKRFRACLDVYRNEGGLSNSSELMERGEEAYAIVAAAFFKELKMQGQNATIPFTGVYHFLEAHFYDFFFSLAKEDWEQKLIKESYCYRDGASTQERPKWLSVYPLLHLEKINLREIRCFEEAEIKLGGESALFLGINGRGKSTLMQLTALLLRNLGSPRSGVPWMKLAKFDSTQQAVCSLTLNYNGQPLEFSARVGENDRLVIDKNFPIESFYKGLMVLAYGAGRNVRLEDVQPAERFESIASLFGDNGYLKNIQQAEVNTLVQQRQEWFLEMLNPILKGGDAQVELRSFTTATALFKTGTDLAGRTPLEAMSDGFRATYAWLFDFLVRVAITGHQTKDIRGIVMVDEIDLHLHPAWQRTLIPTLRKVFPQVQFLFTCHSPYSVQSMDTDKIFLLKQEERQVKVLPLQLDGLPSGQNLDDIIEKTTALEAQLPSVGDALFTKLKEFKSAAINGSKEEVGRHYQELVRRLQINLELCPLNCPVPAHPLTRPSCLGSSTLQESKRVIPTLLLTGSPQEEFFYAYYLFALVELFGFCSLKVVRLQEGRSNDAYSCTRSPFKKITTFHCFAPFDLIWFLICS